MLSEFVACFVGMLKLKVIWTLLLGGTLGIYGIQMAGNMPRYMQIHFNQPAYIANMMAGNYVYSSVKW